VVKSRADKGSVRIIAGQWRSRRLPVVDVPGLRPSGDRSRETLFNWIQAFVPGSKCADLFAGTGALGFEAASRGASSVAMVERDTNVVRHLRDSAALLEADQVEITHGEALSWLDEQSAGTFKIIFVDPPFKDQLHGEVLEKIEQSNCLKQGGLVYVESPASQTAPDTSEGWSCWREKVIGEVRLQVFRR
jgi:16S rRNA (guanine966-N2)-methyltransferase